MTTKTKTKDMKELVAEARTLVGELNEALAAAADPDLTAAWQFESGDVEFTSTVEREVLDELRVSASARREAEERVARAVEVARQAGASWANIGLMLGVSGQAVRQRYGNV